MSNQQQARNVIKEMVKLAISYYEARGFDIKSRSRSKGEKYPRFEIDYKGKTLTFAWNKGDRTDIMRQNFLSYFGKEAFAPSLRKKMSASKRS